MEPEIKRELEGAKELMKELLEDRSVPRNIRAAVQSAVDKLEAEELNAVSFSAAIYDLDDISNDINMPSHARTTLWEIISELERIKEKIKK